MSELNQKLIDAKEKLARTRAAQGRGVGETPSEGRLPPNQVLTDSSVDFPVLDLGIQPEIPLEAWKLEVTGACEQPLELDWNAFQEIGIIDLITDFHCVTKWSCYDMPWKGVSLPKVISMAKPTPAATHIMFHSYDGYTTNVPLADCLQEDCLLATHWNGKPLEVKHGGPVRGMIPHLYAWKSAKWVKAIEFMTQDKRGFWEVRGYHNYGDPFTEQRFSRDE